MARKHIGTILSGVLLFVCVQWLGADASAQSVKVTKQTFRVAGSVGVGNVEIKGFPTVVFADASGQYSAEVDYNWRGTITPVLAGYEFTPKSRPIGPVTANLENQDFSADIQTFVISGSLQMPGVELSGFPESVVSDTSGRYSVKVEYGWSGTVTPIKDGYEFTPPSQTYDKVNRPMTTNYQAKVKQYEIQGTITVSGIPLSGVTLNGLPGNPVTDQSGHYTAQVRYDWNGGEVIPSKAGYEFDPPKKDYTSLMSSVIDDYYGTKLRFTVSGSAGTDNVMIRYPGGTVLTDAMGNFSFELDWGVTGKITPEKDGWKFNPPEIPIAKLQAPMPGQNFDASEMRLTISGSTEVGGAILDGLFDEGGQPVISGTNGFYEVQVSYGFSGNVIPKKDGYTFTPAAKNYDNLKVDRRSETYRAEQIMVTISGNVGNVRGVQLRGFPSGRVVSDAAGLFDAEVPYGWTGAITPELEGYEFSPPSISYQDVVNPMTNEVFTPSVKKYKITGQVNAEDGPLEGVSIVLGSFDTLATTGYDGRYELDVEHGWSGKLQLGKPGYEFPNGSSIDISPVTSDRQIDIQARVKQITIKGTLTDGQRPLAEVALSASNDGGSAVSDARGRWSLQVPYGWTGVINMQKAGLTFPEPQPGDPLYFADPVLDDVDFTQETSSPPPDSGTSTPEPTSGPSVTTPPSTPGTTPGVPKDVGLTREEIQKLLGNSTSTPPATSQEIKPEGGPNQDIIDKINELQKQLSVLRNGENPVDDNVTGAQAGDVTPEIDRGPITQGQVFEGEDLRLVLAQVSADIGFPIIADQDALGYVTASYSDMPVEDALDIILAGTNFYWTKTPHYYLVSTMDLTNPGFDRGTKTKRIRLNYLTPQNALQMLSPTLGKFVKADQDGRAVTITATPKLIDRITSDLKMFDQKPRMVLLEARVVIMEKGDLLNLGINWGWPTVQAGLFASDYKGLVGDPTSNNTFGNGIWGVTMGYSTDNTFTNALTMQLNLLESNDEAQTLSNPSVLAQDGKLAEMNVITEEYYFFTPPDQAAAGIFGRAEMKTIESGTKLSITPYIGDNNDITMDLAVEVSDSIPSGRVSQLPVVTRRTARNTVTVQDSGTAVIAGLNETKRKIDNASTPGFSRLPIIGSLFDNKYKERENRDIAIFVTAKIVKDGSPSPMSRAPSTMGPGDFSGQPPVDASFNRQGNDFRSDLSQALARRR